MFSNTFSVKFHTEKGNRRAQKIDVFLGTTGPQGGTIKGLTETKIKTLNTPGRYGDRTPTSVRLYPAGTSSASARRPFPTALPIVPCSLFIVFAFLGSEFSLDAL